MLKTGKTNGPFETTELYRIQRDGAIGSVFLCAKKTS